MNNFPPKKDAVNVGLTPRAKMLRAFLAHRIPIFRWLLLRGKTAGATALFLFLSSAAMATDVAGFVYCYNGSIQSRSGIVIKAYRLDGTYMSQTTTNGDGYYKFVPSGAYDGLRVQLRITYQGTTTTKTITIPATSIDWSIDCCPTISPQVNSATICQGESTVLTVTNCAGTVTWFTPGQSNPRTVSPSTTTTYTAYCTVNDCVGSVQTTVTVNPKPTPSVNSATICDGESATLSVSNCGGSILWNTGATSSSITVNPNTTTNYTATCTVGGCQGTATGTVTVNPKPNPSIVSVRETVICQGNSATLSVFNCAGSVQWSTGETSSSITISPSSTTTYTVTCTVGNCQGAASGTITVNPNPNPSINNAAICAGQSATLSISNCGGSVLWNTGATSSSITVNPGSTTNYSATCTVGGCQGTATGTVTVNPNPTPSVNSATICAGQSATLSISNCGGSVLWNTGATSSSITVNPGSTTNYSATCTVGSCQGEATGTVTVNPNPNPSVNNATICAGESATLTATNCSGSISWNTGATTASITVTPTTTTTYTATCTVGSCKGTASGTVTVNLKPTPSVNNATICVGESATLTATNCGGSISWNTGATTASLTVTPTATTTYTATCTVGSCKGTASGTVTVNPKPNPSVNNATICAGESATLTATNCGGSISWNTGATTAAITVTPTATTTYTATCTVGTCKGTASGTVTVNPKPTLSITSTTCATDLKTYTVTFTSNGTVSADKGTVSGTTVTGIPTGQTVTLTADLNGCKVTATATKNCTCPTINPPVGTSKTICAGDAIPALTVTVDAGLQADWYATATSTTKLASGLSYTPTASQYPLGGDFYVEAINTASGCKSTTRTKVSLTVNPKPTLSTQATCAADGLTYTVSVTTDAVSISADKGTVTGLTVTGVPSGQTVTITATSAAGCKATTAVTQNCTTPKGSLGDYVWKDANNDGIQQNTEAPVKGVILQLLQGTTVVATDTTDAEGLYLFPNLSSGTYQVKILTGSLPAGCSLSTKQNLGGDDAKDSDFDPTTGLSQTVIINALGAGIAKNNLTIDAALVVPCVKPNAGPDQNLTCALIGSGTADLTDAAAGQKWKVLSVQAGTTVTVTTPAGAVSGMTVPGAYAFVLQTQSDSLACRDTVNVFVPECICPTVNVLTPNATVCKDSLFPTLTVSINGTNTAGISAVWYGNAVGGNILGTGLNFKPAGVASVTDTFFVQLTGVTDNCLTNPRTPVVVNVQNCSVAVDLALKKSIDKKTAQIGDVLTYTLKVWNESNTNATGVTVVDSIAATVQFQTGSFIPSRGTATITDNVIQWNIGNIAANGDTVTLTYRIKATQEGVHFNTAEICKTNEKDVDSTPCNHDDEEDDIDRQCFTVPFKLCPGEKVEVNVPAYLTNVQWFKNGSTTAVASGNKVLLSDIGSYTFTATNQTCPIGGCCPVIIEAGTNCCPDEVCIPFTIKKRKK